MDRGIDQHPSRERPQREIAAGECFAFGANWSRFLRLLDASRIEAARRSLLEMIGARDLSGRRFLDVGSGSGLFSLAARSLGARVHSFDYDPRSVACTAELKRRYFAGDPDWTVEQASALDAAHLQGLGRFDVVYSWGVLHHTGAMWQAMGLVAGTVDEGGLLFISIYNDQGWPSRGWARVKRLYNRLPPALRWLVLAPAFVRLRGPMLIRSLLRGRPLAMWREYSRARGMSPWHDVVDWVGGWPFEVARPEAVFDFLQGRGFALRKLKTCGGGKGCNEYLFQREAPRP
jgi:2-polyprenyl-6-hydroxyphenyl methylase/3-demethylubiquinone-9 3-methyltransferase